MIDYLKNEKDILISLDHPFLISMDFVFQNELRIFFFLEYIRSGDLFLSLFKVKRFNEEKVKFISA